MRSGSIIKKLIYVISLTLLLSGMSGYVQTGPAPKDLQKKTDDKNAGIVIPSFNASPYDILEKSYDRLDAFMYDPEAGIFMGLSTSIFDFAPHKLTFHHKKFGFTTSSAYKVRIAFFDKKKPQKMLNFSFSPFEITEPKLRNEVITIADAWVKFFDSLGWKRSKQDLNYPYGPLPENGSWPYMEWDTDDFELSVNIERNKSPSNVTKDPRYYITIVFANRKKEFSPNDYPKKTKDKNAGIVIPSFDASPYDVLENSYDRLDASMYDEEEKIFAFLLAPRNEAFPRKLTFYHKKLGFVTKNSYELNISFNYSKKEQKISNFSFSPFKKTDPKLKEDAISIANSWVEFFDSLGWKRKQKAVNYPRDDIAEDIVWPYMEWYSDDCDLSVEIKRSKKFYNPTDEARYIVTIFLANKKEYNFIGK